MCSKLRLLYALMAGLLFTLQGCGLKWGEKPPFKDEIRIGEFACMSHIPEIIQQYMQAQYSSSQTDEFFGCMDESLKSFQTYVHGDLKDTFSPDELRSFLETNMLGGRRISDEFMTEFMIFKAQVVGGNTRELRRDELESTRKILEMLKEIAISLKPYIPVLNPELLKQSSMSETELISIEDSGEALKASAQRIGEVLRKARRPYAIRNFERLLIEFRKFAGWSDDEGRRVAISQWLRLIESFKDALVGSPGGVIAPEEWPRLLYQAAGWYSLWMRQQALLRSEHLFQDPGMSRLIGLVGDFKDLLERAVDSQRGSEIEYNKIQVVLKDMETVGLLSNRVKEFSRPLTLASSLSSLIQTFFTKVLGPDEIAPRERTVGGITKAALAVLGQEHDRWATVQRYLNSVFFEIPSPQTQAVRSWFEVQSVRQNRSPAELVRSLGSSTAVPSDVINFMTHIQKTRPLFREAPHDPNDRWTMRVFLASLQSPEVRDVGFSFYDLSWHNLLQTGVRLLFRGFVEDRERRLRFLGATKQEVQNFYTDMRPIGEYLEVFDPRNSKAGDRSFNEGKLFTYAARGVNEDSTNPDLTLLRFDEASQLIGYLISGGTLGRKFYHDLRDRAHCEAPAGTPGDIFGDPKLRIDCFVDHLQNEYGNYIWHMPDLQRYVRSLSPDDRRTLIDVMILAVRDPRQMENLIEKSEIVAFSVVAQYLESVFDRFDRNRDGFLDDEETDDALPIYQGLILRTARLQKIELRPWQTRYAFKFILKNARLPKPDDYCIYRTWVGRLDCADAIHILNLFWREWVGDLTQWTTRGYVKVIGWNLHMSRMDLARTFQVIIQTILESDRCGGAPCVRPAAAD